MLATDSSDQELPVAFCLHYLGGSAREWQLVARRLASKIEILAIDLPGFGDARAVPGYSVAEMATFVAEKIRARAARRWILVGHSMGAKVVAVLASEIERGDRNLSGLVGLVAIAGSPPSPEPMDDEQRAKMLGWFAGDAASRESQAREFVSTNSERLDAGSTELAVSDVLRANRMAWIAWLESGSREDWSGRVGVLGTPAIVVAGADDPKLGPDAQQNLMVPHFANAQVLSLARAKHLLPMECAEDIARAIDLAVAVAGYRALIASSRVSTPTREALQSRERPTAAAHAPKALHGPALQTLRAVLDCVIPQAGFPPIDLAARIDEQLHAAQGDGWRFAALPPDAAAYAAALATLDDAARSGPAAKPFCELDASAREAMLRAIAAGEFGSPDRAPDARLNGEQMRLWFEDLRADAVKAFTLHPMTLARMGYSGIANGGDGTPKSGFVRVGVGERESWEPVGFGESRS